MNPRRVPSQQATLHKRMTAGGHFQYGNTRMRLWDVRRSLTTLLPDPFHSGGATSAIRVTSRGMVGARLLAIRSNIHYVSLEREF